MQLVPFIATAKKVYSTSARDARLRVANDLLAL
jgi:hypothetical protein